MRRLRTLACLLVAVPFAAGACSSAVNDSASVAKVTTTAAMHDMADMAGMPGMGTTASGKVDCAQHMPGDRLTAEEAMVIFDAEHVCLGYVTVAAGTAITWHNADDVERRVIVEDGNGTALMTFDILPGGATQRALKVPGVYRYRVSAIESFVGSIEVQAA